MAISGGYVLRPRCIKEGEFAHASPCTREIFDFLYREANHQEKKYNGYVVKRGQLFRSYSEIKEALHWFKGWEKKYYSENQVKKAMEYLKKKKVITTKRELGGVLITICDYAYWQNPKNYEGTTDRTKEKAIKEPLENRQGTIYNNNEKKENNIKENKYMSEIKDSDDINDYLKIALRFWKLYKKNLSEFNRNEKILENAKCKTWEEPIRKLIEIDNKTYEEIEEVYEFLSENEFWKTQIYSTSKLREKNSQRIMYIDYFLLNKTKINQDKSLATPEEYEPVLKKYFNRTTPYFSSLFDNYQKMKLEKSEIVLRGKKMEFEINKLAQFANNDSMIAVNILKNSINKKIEICPLN